MEDTISQILETDEKILWTGKPESFTALDATHKKFFINRVIT